MAALAEVLWSSSLRPLRWTTHKGQGVEPFHSGELLVQPHLQRIVQGKHHLTYYAQFSTWPKVNKKTNYTKLPLALPKWNIIIILCTEYLFLVHGLSTKAHPQINITLHICSWQTIFQGVPNGLCDYSQSCNPNTNAHRRKSNLSYCKVNKKTQGCFFKDHLLDWHNYRSYSGCSC